MNDFLINDAGISGTNDSINNQSHQSQINSRAMIASDQKPLPEILFISSYPPRECGIATYTQDLIKALENKFAASFELRVCALETGEVSYKYGEEVKFILNASSESEYNLLANIINGDNNIKIVLVQHEFGLFRYQEQAFLDFLHQLSKPVIAAFHSVLPTPNLQLKESVLSIVSACNSVIVMTNKSADVLAADYGINPDLITVIPHGTHLVPHLDKNYLKEKFGLKDRKVLSTFGLLSSGKGIETTIRALPSIVASFPEVVFLVIGKTHPGVVRAEGEIYREKLKSMVEEYSLSDHVIFVNNYLELPELLEYLQLTDIYIFTSMDPNQAVSGTFAYAMSCSCPIISTPIPHAREILTGDSGFLIDFGNSQQLADAVLRLLNDEPLRSAFAKNALQKIVSTVWENSAIAHASLLEKLSGNEIQLIFNPPEINLRHLQKMTTDIGMIQFSIINQPDIESGYTLDDNARAMYCFARHYQLTGDEKDLHYIKIFLSFIKHCQQKTGDFLNYVDKDKNFTPQNFSENLDDCNGRALIALSFLTTIKEIIPAELVSEAEEMIGKLLPHIESIHSTRAMAYSIKALYMLSTKGNLKDNSLLIILANRLVRMFEHESEPDWQWFENYLTYANSILPEAMCYAWLLTRKPIYKEIALASLDFLLSLTFKEHGIEVISNKKWHFKGSEPSSFGEQSIDVSSTIQTLSVFYDAFGDEDYFNKMQISFDWFLGKNRLHQIIYNPCTGGCYDGLEEHQINLNEGAESSLSYLMSRLTIDRYSGLFAHPKGLLTEKKNKGVESLVRQER